MSDAASDAEVLWALRDHLAPTTVSADEIDDPALLRQRMIDAAVERAARRSASDTEQ